MTQNPSQTFPSDCENRAVGYRLHDIAAYWAQQRPEAQALSDAESGRVVNWRNFDRYTLALAVHFKQMGLAKGDYAAMLLPISIEQVLIAFACFRLGAVVLPLDLGLPESVVYSLFEQLKPRAFFGAGVKGALDLRPLWAGLSEHCSSTKLKVAVASSVPIDGAATYEGIHYYAWRAAMTCASIELADEVDKEDAALVFLNRAAEPAELTSLSHHEAMKQYERTCTEMHGVDPEMHMLADRHSCQLEKQLGALMSVLYAGATVHFSCLSHPSHRSEVC